ncbi:MAG: glutathione S-transferase family protein [Gammaproteobacteria bacterium]|nr:glutathione S-transferase family protein [Gammaproteobacteria bacterium]
MHLVLYSFRICPFVERTNILLNEKNIECERVYVDIRNKPDWFLKLSPLGKVPVLSADKAIIFESTVINEYLDEISSLPLLYPNDPIQKARNKSWIEWGSTLVFDAYYMTLASNKLEFVEKQKIVNSKLVLLEQELRNTPFFNGEKFSMIDLAYAPLFRRFDSLVRQFSIDTLEQYPKLKIWSNHILKKESVQNGFAHNFDEEFYQLLKLKGSCLISSETKNCI